MEISVVVPVYGCREALPELHRRLTDALSSITDSYEIILVDDRCPQNSWEEIAHICHTDKHVLGIHFARNFGQAHAITAGLVESRGDWIVVMDCDLQDPPEAIPELYAKAHEGYDVVFARRNQRKDTLVVRALSRAFYRVYSYFADTVQDGDAATLSIASRRTIEAMLQLHEQGRDYVLTLSWIGFEQTSIDIVAGARYAGESSYTFRRKIDLAITSITTHSNKPLTFVVKTGFLIALISFLILLWLIVGYFIDPNLPIGWTSSIASIFLMGGLTIAVIGVVGIYVGYTFEESKRRPLYLIEDALNRHEPGSDTATQDRADTERSRREA